MSHLNIKTRTQIRNWIEFKQNLSFFYIVWKQQHIYEIYCICCYCMEIIILNYKIKKVKQQLFNQDDIFCSYVSFLYVALVVYQNRIPWWIENATKIELNFIYTHNKVSGEKKIVHNFFTRQLPALSLIIEFISINLVLVEFNTILTCVYEHTYTVYNKIISEFWIESSKFVIYA